MADDPKDPKAAPPAPAPAPAAAPAEAGLGDRVGMLEEKLDQLIKMGGGGDGGQVPEAGGSVAAEIAAQLEQRDRERAAAAASKASDDRVGALEATVKDLAEKQPQPLVRRVSKVMGWGG